MKPERGRGFRFGEFWFASDKDVRARPYGDAAPPDALDKGVEGVCSLTLGRER